MTKKVEIADVAGGCFWGVEEALSKIPGVISTEVGYEGGHKPQPTYLMVCSHVTGHAETVRVSFDPKIISYRQILEYYMNSHNPTEMNRQGPDVGDNYRSAIFYHSDKQKDVAENLIQEINESGKYDKPVVTQVVPTTKFWPAEDYHQQYFAKQRGEI
ncbi:MAG: peptide-methionine (S)-S-oxide reductase MsrA [bacterium]